MRARLAGAACALVLVMFAGSAEALELLPIESELGDHEARILVRSAAGSVHVDTEPPLRAAGAAPGAPQERIGGLMPTPRDIAATHVWRGLDGIVLLVLHRDDPAIPADIVLEDGAGPGLWLSWPAAAPAPSAAIPGPGAWGALITLALGGLASGRPGGRRIGEKR